MKNNSEVINEIVKNVHCIVGIPMINTRRHPHSQLRAAIAMALTPRFNTIEISKSLQRDRTAVSYYKKNHKANLAYWKNYKQFYDIAEEQAASVFEDEAIYSSLEMIDKKIDILLEQRKKLIQK
mgnify:CR=1 FL=1|tara:strand:- start:817 stop:1188 length:372 start_codon:yes stop_codon:yes gene_type:complete